MFIYICGGKLGEILLIQTNKIMKINYLAPVNGGGYACPEVIKTQIKVEQGFAVSGIEFGVDNGWDDGTLPGAGRYDFEF